MYKNKKMYKNNLYPYVYVCSLFLIICQCTHAKVDFLIKKIVLP